MRQTWTGVLVDYALSGITNMKQLEDLTQTLRSENIVVTIGDLGELDGETLLGYMVCPQPNQHQTFRRRFVFRVFGKKGEHIQRIWRLIPFIEKNGFDWMFYPFFQLLHRQKRFIFIESEGRSRQEIFLSIDYFDRNGELILVIVKEFLNKQFRNVHYFYSEGMSWIANDRFYETLQEVETKIHAKYQKSLSNLPFVDEFGDDDLEF